MSLRHQIVLCFLLTAAVVVGYALLHAAGAPSFDSATASNPQDASTAEVDFQNLLAELVTAEPAGIGSGSWEFPESRWRMRVGEVSGAADLQKIEGSVCGELQPDPLDEQLSFLIEQVMEPAQVTGSLQVFSVNRPRLRGNAVTCSHEDGRAVLKLCLRWPADGDLWNEVQLERRDRSRIRGLLARLPDGANQRAVRRRADGTVDCEVFETGQSSGDLQAWMQSEGWKVINPPDLEHVFWTAREDDRLEVTLRPKNGGDGVVAVLRQLSTIVVKGDLK